MKKRRLIILGVLCLVLAAAAQAADFLYIPWLDAYADRSRLFLCWGFYGENIALQVSFGEAAIGIQFNETGEDTGRLNAARDRLQRILATRDFNLDDLPKSLGLTFVRFVKFENVIPTVLR